MDVRRGILVALVVPVLAGCISDGKLVFTGVPVETMPLTIFPGDRPISATSVWHEEVHDATPEPVDDGFILENSWEPRDVDLTYHGVQPVYDEWGREVPAHIFRYEPMELTITDIEFLSDFSDVRITARYEAGRSEFAFDQADGHFLGYLDLKHQVRVFEDARWPTPLAVGYEADLLIPLAYLYLGGDISTPIPGPLGDTFLNRTDLKPLDGDCTAYEIEFTPAPWYQRWVDEQRRGEPEVPVPEEEYHNLVCLQGEGAPLWVYLGNTTDHLSLTRVSGRLPTPRLQGDVLPPRVVETQPFQSIDLLLGLAAPIRVPPSGYPGDWADIVRPVVSGVGTNVEYLQWQLEREGLFLADIMKAFPYFGAPIIPLLPVDPLAFEETSWVMVADGDAMFWAFVDSKYGGPEDPDLHMSRNGFAFDDYPTKEVPIVAAGDVQAAWENLVPPDPAVLSYSSFPDVLDDFPPEYREYLAPFLTSWSALEYCWEVRDDGRYADFSATNGQMLVMAGQTSTLNSCGTGVDGDDGFVRIGSGQQEMLLRRPMNGEPGVLFIPASGEAYVWGGRPSGAAHVV